MIDATGTNKAHVVGGVVGLNIRRKVITLDGKNVLLWAEDCVTECLTCAMEVINGVPGCNLDGGGILGNQWHGWSNTTSSSCLSTSCCSHKMTSRSCPMALLELGVLEDVRDDVNSLWDLLAKDLGVINHLLAQSVRIEVGTEILHLDLEGVMGATASALESHVAKIVAASVDCRPRKGEGEMEMER
jgi:hypothetical protein